VEVAAGNVETEYAQEAEKAVRDARRYYERLKTGKLYVKVPRSWGMLERLQGHFRCECSDTSQRLESESSVCEKQSHTVTSACISGAEINWIGPTSNSIGVDERFYN
jgi:hypothetical protein